MPSEDRFSSTGSTHFDRPELDTSDGGALTRLLVAWSEGESEVLPRLADLVLDELRRTARALLRRERAGHTLQPTALVNEAFVRLLRQERVAWRDRRHFLAVVATLMRRILVDHARVRNAGKRGGGAVELTEMAEMDRLEVPAQAKSLDLLILDEAIDELTRLDPQQGRIVQCHLFLGLTQSEIAAELGISRVTVNRDWVSARAWLHGRLS